MIPFDSSKEAERITSFIKETFQKEGFSQAVIGLSGGIDSAVSCALSVRALGEGNVYPILLPHGVLNTQGVLDGMKLIETLHIPFTHVTRIDITPSVAAITKSDPVMDRVRRGNIMARVRMIHLFDQAKKHQALVVGTENKTEHFLGYYTRFGDEASDVEPMRHLYKTQVFELAKYLKIPEEIVIKPPSADLWPEQTDEKEFGFTYKEADEILSLFIDEKNEVESIIQHGYAKEVVSRILSHMKITAFKTKTPYRVI